MDSSNLLNFIDDILSLYTKCDEKSEEVRRLKKESTALSCQLSKFMGEQFSDRRAINIAIEHGIGDQGQNKLIQDESTQRKKIQQIQELISGNN